MDFSPLWISLKISVLSTILTFVLGILAAWGIGRTQKVKNILDSLLSLPLVLPPTVTGFFLLMLFSRYSHFGSLLAELGLHFLFTWQGGVIAALVISFPVMYRTTRGAFEQIDRTILDAARTLGMSEFDIFRKLMIPNSLPGVAAATMLSFARSLGEFGATIMVAGNIPGKTQTMAVAVYTAMQGGNKILAFKWVSVIFALSLLILLLMNFLTEKHSLRRQKR